MSTKVVKLIYNPEIDKVSARKSSHEYTGNIEEGYYLLKEEGVVEWLYCPNDSLDGENCFVQFVDELSEHLQQEGIFVSIFAHPAYTRDLLPLLEGSYLKWWFGQHQDIPLISFKGFERLVDEYAGMFPETFNGHTGNIDLGDIINETGMSDIDIHSIRNMLSHYQDEYWTWKAERMTIIAYKYGMDIHPLAIALTPTVVSQIKE